MRKMYLLFEDSFHAPSTFFHIALNTPRKHEIRIALHKDLENCVDYLRFQLPDPVPSDRTGF